MAEAPGLDALYDTYANDGFIVVTLLGENSFGNTPSQDELMQWADAFGIGHPVVADPGWGTTIRYIDGYSIALPSMHLIAPGGEVLVRGGWVSEQQVQQNLP